MNEFEMITGIISNVIYIKKARNVLVINSYVIIK